MADNPFGSSYNAILDPNQGGTIMGAIGGLMGAPTRSQAAGSATSQALSELSALRDQGLPPQQALIKFFQTPTGHDFFVNAGPDGLKTLVDGMQATQAPAPIMHNVPEGGALYSTSPTTGQTSLAASNPKSYPPTTLGPQDIAVDRAGNKIAENTNQKATETPADVRSFQYFAQIAKLPPDEIKRIAALKADPTSKDPNSVKAAAVDELVKTYGLDPRLGESLKADVVKVIPLKNEFGQDTGAISVYDSSNPAAGAQVINPGGKGPAATGTPSAAPGTSPSTGSATGVLPPVEPTPAPAAGTPKATISGNNPKYFGDKASMFLGSGPIANGLAAASGVSEMVNPKMIIPEGAQAADRKTMVDTLRSDLAAMGQLGGGIGVNKGVLEGYLKLAPTGGVTESPHQAIQKAIRLSEHIDQEIEAEGATAHNSKLPIEERKAAAARIDGWSRVKRDLPTYEELTKMEEAIRNGTAGAPTIASGVKTLTDAAGKTLTEGKKQATEVQTAVAPGAVNIDAISDPKELLAIDPRSLGRNDKIKYLRKLDSMKKGTR